MSPRALDLSCLYLPPLPTQHTHLGRDPPGAPGLSPPEERLNQAAFFNSPSLLKLLLKSKTKVRIFFFSVCLGCFVCGLVFVGCFLFIFPTCVFSMPALHAICLSAQFWGLSSKFLQQHVPGRRSGDPAELQLGRTLDFRAKMSVQSPT